MARKSIRFNGLLLLMSMLGFVPRADSRPEQTVRMEAIAPTCGMEVLYRRTWDGGRKRETYAVHAEKIDYHGSPAFQSISVYHDRVRRITMRETDLTPLVMIEKWNRGRSLIMRVYENGRVRAVRRSLPYPIDEVIEVPTDVHDPESFAFLLKGYPFELQDSIAPIQVLVAEPNPLLVKPRVLDVIIYPQGEERITTPAGTFDCWVLEMGAAGALGKIVPENRFWLLKDDPHLIVKATALGEVLELVRGAAACDGIRYCKAGAEIPESLP